MCSLSKVSDDSFKGTASIHVSLARFQEHGYHHIGTNPRAKTTSVRGGLSPHTSCVPECRFERRRSLLSSDKTSQPITVAVFGLFTQCVMASPSLKSVGSRRGRTRRGECAETQLVVCAGGVLGTKNGSRCKFPSAFPVAYCQC